ncbi:hypothetical protein JW935_08455 [candidate division KSB1 bacterium]|nr:hypothetical protein [candidate division KSB1 bacterium]
MQKVTYALTILVLAAGSFAQTGTNEFYASYGVITIQDFAEVGKSIASAIASSIGSGIVDAFLGEGTADRLKTTETDGTGCIILGYNHYPSRRFSWGILGSYAHYDVTYTYESGKTAFDDDDFITAMARMDYRWIYSGNIRLYSGLAAGACYYHSKGTSAFTTNIYEYEDWLFAFQANLLGVSFGRTVRGFVELGFGYNGILNGGLAVAL